MKCEHCGSEVADDSIFCKYCGKPLIEVSETDDFEDGVFIPDEDEEIVEVTVTDSSGKKVVKKRRRRIKKKNKPAIIAAVLVMVLAVGVLLFLMSGVGDSPREKYEASVEKIDKAIAVNNFGEAKLYFDEAVKYYEQVEDQKSSEKYVLEQKKLLIVEGSGDTAAVEKTLRELIDMAGSEGYLSDKRDYCERLLAVCEANEDDEALGELIKSYKDSDDEKIAQLTDRFRPAAPVFGSVPSEPHPGDTVSVSCEEDCLLFYSASDKRIKKTGSADSNYDELVLQAGENNFYVYCKNKYGLCSDIAVFTYELSTVYKVQMPEITPQSGEYSEPFQITINVPAGLRAYYCWNGTPDESSERYVGPVNVIEGNNVFNAIFVDEYGNRSNVQRANYIYMRDVAEEPPEEMPEEPSPEVEGESPKDKEREEALRSEE